MSVTAPAFRTPRLNVYRLDYVPDPTRPGDIGGQAHALFIGIDPKIYGMFVSHAPATTVTVRLSDAYIEFVETAKLRQRRGYAEELLRGIEQHLNRQLWGVPCTRAGQRLESARKRVAL